MSDEIVFGKTLMDDRPKCVTEGADRERAAKLRAFARSFGWDVPNSPEYWAYPLAILRRCVGTEAVGDVLDWYVCWYKPGRRPQIRDGREFRRQWNWLQRIYESEQTVASPVPPGFQWVVDDLKSLEWPARAAAQVQGVAVKSYAALLGFLADARAKPADYREVVFDVVGSAAEFAREWFHAAHKRYAGWDSWSGDLLPMAWTPDHPEFEKRCRDECLRHTGDSSAWDRIFKG